MAEPVVCIFPHSDKEFRTPDALRDFLMGKLKKERNGRYDITGKLKWIDKNFVERVIRGSLILFSKKGLIVGRAITTTTIEKLESPEETETETGAKAICYYRVFFDPKSIKVCPKPLAVEQIERWADRKHNLHSYRILGTRRAFKKAFPDC